MQKKESASIEKLAGTISLSVKGTIPLKVKQSYKVKVTMGKGDKVVSWKSSNAKAVSVKNGVIKGRKSREKGYHHMYFLRVVKKQALT